MYHGFTDLPVFKENSRPSVSPTIFPLLLFGGPMGDIISRVSFALVNRRENVNFMYGECILMAFLYTIYLKYEFILRWQSSNIKWYVHIKYICIHIILC